MADKADILCGHINSRVALFISDGTVIEGTIVDVDDGCIILDKSRIGSQVLFKMYVDLSAVLMWSFEYD